jgi:hypothetical protein
MGSEEGEIEFYGYTMTGPEGEVNGIARTGVANPALRLAGTGKPE